ncbi:MAG: acetoin utilization protein AcuC [Anaerolineae bacterium]
MRHSAFLCSPELWAQGHGDEHPMRPERLEMTYALLQAYGAFEGEGSALVAPTPASEEELALWHTREYIGVVRRLSTGETGVPARRYNFGPGDNPAFPGMYESESLKVGATLKAARMVAAGECAAAFSFAGGLHHAMPARASGFCVFNDAAIAVRWLMGTGRRVLYVDIDAHHGDGVQAACYDSERAMTISFHESGRYLFPGTGYTDEIGTGAGRGTSANVPLLPYTDDAAYLAAFDAVVPVLAERFAPDVLVTQLGIDTHYQDPLTHLALTTHGYAALVRSFHDMGLPWVALGGGGYNVHTVARAWTLAYGIMSEQAFADEIPASYAARYGDRWLHDRGGPRLDPRDATRARTHAERQAAAVLEALGV